MKKLFLILFIASLTLQLKAQNENINLIPYENYPLWLSTNQDRTEQTSGIAFIKSECDLDYFLLADDIGAIHLLTIKDDAIYKIEKVEFIEETDDFFPNGGFVSTIENRSPGSFARLSAPLLIGHGSASIPCR